MTAAVAAASLLLAGGAGMLASLLVAPVRGRWRMAALTLGSVMAVGLGLLLIAGAPSLAAAMPG